MVVNLLFFTRRTKVIGHHVPKVQRFVHFRYVELLVIVGTAGCSYLWNGAVGEHGVRWRICKGTYGE